MAGTAAKVRTGNAVSAQLKPTSAMYCPAYAYRTFLSYERVGSSGPAYLVPQARVGFSGPVSWTKPRRPSALRLRSGPRRRAPGGARPYHAGARPHHDGGGGVACHRNGTVMPITDQAGAAGLACFSRSVPVTAPAWGGPTHRPETSALIGWPAEDRLTVQPDSEATSLAGRSATAGTCASTVSVLFACSREAAASSSAPAWVYAWADCSHASRT